MYQYPMVQILKNFNFVRGTIKVHLAELKNRQAWEAIASQVADLQKEAFALLKEEVAQEQAACKSTPAATPANTDSTIMVLSKAVTNKVAARMAMRELIAEGNKIKARLKRARRPETVAKLERQLAVLRQEYRKAAAYIKNPANPEV